MISHSITLSSVASIVNSAQHLIDVSKDYDLTIKVRDGIVHTDASNRTGEVKKCIECSRYDQLLERRERESYPNVAPEDN